jgi:hypothetical protein
MSWRSPLAAGLAALLAMAPSGARAQDVRQDMSPETNADEVGGVPGDRSSGADEAGADPSGVDAAAELSAAAQVRLDAGDREGAIALWRQAFEALPGGYGYAPRRATAALALAAAEEAAFRETGEPGRLHAAIEALDAYLGGLDPTDDENRAGVEGRRAELYARYHRASAPQGPPPPPRAETGRRGLDRRAGLAAAGLGSGAVVAGVVALAGGLAGRGADGDLARVTARPCAGKDPLDPCGSDSAREEKKAELVTEGLRANRMAMVGGILAGALLTASVAALIAGAIRGRSRVQARASGLVIRF